MKKLLLIIFLGILLSENVFAQSMISISKYLQKNKQSSKDPNSQVYITVRCSAVNLYMYTLTEVKNPSASKNYAKAYEDFYIAASKVLAMNENLNLEEASDNVNNDLEGMMQYYIKDGDDYFIRTGKHIIGNYIGDDLRFCKKLHASL